MTTSISVSTYLEFVASTMAAMVSTVRWLGDERVNQRPRLPGANSPYAIVVHCCGVMEWWGGHVIAGCPVSRDREAEFRATGTVLCAGGAATAYAAPTTARRPPGSTT